MRVLVLGGIRSGKSAWAERRLAGRDVHYVATAPSRPGDPDWAARVAAHQARRPAGWTTTEATGDDLSCLLRDAVPGDALLVDDVGNWLTSALDAAGAWDDPAGARLAGPAAAELEKAVLDCPADLVLVSPEVGWGVVPATRAGRVFADAQGSLNQRLASACDEVVLVVAGLAQRLK
jgi:adenosylcobinamide kinase/adenosylcobinamide-phosphate guanylyltransferase